MRPFHLQCLDPHAWPTMAGLGVVAFRHRRSPLRRRRDVEHPVIVYRALLLSRPDDWTPDFDLSERRMYRWNGEAYEYRPMTDEEWEDAYTHWAVR